MKKDDYLAKLESIGLIPIVRVSNEKVAYKTGLALYNGGIEVIEITMTVPNALGVISDLRDKLQEKVLVGAGTVLDSESASAAIMAGAQFLVAPNLDAGFIEICRRYSVISIPGALTPTEILQAWSLGADIVKVFPAGLVGGPKYISAVKEAMPQVKLLGLGKVNLETVVEYIKAGADLVGVGTSLVDKVAIAENRFEVITEKAKQFKKVVLDSRRED